MIQLLLVTAVVMQDSTRFTLTQAVDRALATYPSVAAARASRDRAQADHGEANAGWLPRLSADASLTQFEQPMVVQPLHRFDPTNPPLFDRTLVQSSVSLNYTLFDFGQRSARVRGARALVAAAHEALSAAGQRVVARAVNAYLRVLTTRDILEAQDQRLTALAAAADRVRRLQAEGKAARLETIRMEAELARARADRIAADAQLDMAEHELAQLADLPYDAVHGATLQRLVLTDSSTVPDSSFHQRSAVVSRARDASPEVREVSRRADAARAGVALARAARLPELRVSGAYVDRGRGWGDFAAEWQAGVSLSYPLFSPGLGSVVRRADADARTATEHLRGALLNVDREVDQALASWREAHARVAALERAVEQSAEVTRIERLSLDVGSGTQTDYLDAEANLLGARASLIEARHAEISARVELARLTGELSRDWLTRTVESGS